jgi:hydroxyacylglutathione hydrolase
MLFQRIESEGLAHYSYLIGEGGAATVIDPRRDCQVYVDNAHRAGMRIAYILETHRNEDYVIGSVELAARTEAEIWHADAQWDYQYGQPVEDGQTWELGQLRLKAIHTPGHTPGSMSYLLHEPGGEPWMIFTGDALFAGDVGRVDLLGTDRMEEMASLLHESLFAKILPLGDHVLVCPAHGSGSVCGSTIADRIWTTIGLERQLNPRLRFAEKGDFVGNVAERLELPPYFDRMERWNVQGAPVLGPLPSPTPLTPSEFSTRAQEASIVDTRTAMGFGAAHVPGAVSIWQGGLASFAGWFVPYDRPLLLIGEQDETEQTVRTLIRIGFDDLAGTLAGGMLSWHTAGLESRSIGTVTVQELCRRLDANQDAWILDVRSEDELATEGRIRGAHHIHLTQLPHHMDEVSRDEPVYIFCGSGLRSMIGASLLHQEGKRQLSVVLGGISGWNSVACDIV